MLPHEANDKVGEVARQQVNHDAPKEQNVQIHESQNAVRVHEVDDPRNFISNGVECRKISRLRVNDQFQDGPSRHNDIQPVPSVEQRDDNLIIRTTVSTTQQIPS